MPNALRLAETRAVLASGTKSQDGVDAQTTTCEERGAPKESRAEVLLLTSLTPYR